MSVEANKQVVRRFIEEMLTQQDLEVAADLFTEDFIDHDADDPDGRLSGVDGARAEVAVFHTAFPDMRVTAHELIAEGDRVALRGELAGTNTGPLFGMPATGRAARVPAWQIYRLHDSKIAEAWLNIDRLSLLQQLGVIPMPEPAVM